MKRIMLVGESGAGKTTFTQAINQETIKYKKTQAIEIINKIIDTPGEYVENRAYYKAILITSVEAEVIVLVQDATRDKSIFPPNFATMFMKPVIGVVTKIDDENAQIELASNMLIQAGVSQVFHISSIKKQGIDSIREYLRN